LKAAPPCEKQALVGSRPEHRQALRPAFVPSARRRAPVNRTAEAVRSLGEIELVALLYVERLRP